MKICSKCKTIKNKDDFFKDKKSSDGLQSQCKNCKSDGLCKYYKTTKGKKSRKKGDKRTAKDRRVYKLAYYHKNKLRFNMSRSINRCLRGNKGGIHWVDLVGYSLQELRDHLEDQFVEGMSWENYGGCWHVDHIRPISSFEIENIDDIEFKECWALSNLQPLFAEENLRKSNKQL